MLLATLLQEGWSGFVQGIPESESLKLTLKGQGKGFSKYSIISGPEVRYAFRDGSAMTWLCLCIAQFEHKSNVK